MKYIGNKTRIIEFIEKALIEEKVDYRNKRVLDLFSGTGSVSSFFISNNCDVISCDNMFYSVCEQYRINYFKKEPDFTEISFNSLSDLLKHLNNLKGEKGYFFDNYAPSGEEKRQYFSDINAMKIDAIRMEIDKYKNKLPTEKFCFLLGILMNAADKVSNTSGTYGAYLKIWRSMALKEINLEAPIYNKNGACLIKQQTALDCVKENKGLDIIYLDPPYNKRQYASNYHVLENICVYDRSVLKGKTGLRDYKNQKSNYCIKSRVYKELNELINNCDAKTIIMSYSTEGLLKEKEIFNILSLKGKTTIHRKEYRRFKTNSNTKANTGLNELLFVCKTVER